MGCGRDMRNTCKEGKIKMERPRFPMHAYVANTKCVADDTLFLEKIPPNNQPLVIYQSRNGSTLRLDDGSVS
jgi:hypothetical protein